MKFKNLSLAILLAFSFSGAVLASEVQYSQSLVTQAKKGNAQAQYDLGEAYYQGYAVDEDLAEAFKWFQKAAAQGH